MRTLNTGSLSAAARDTDKRSENHLGSYWTLVSEDVGSKEIVNGSRTHGYGIFIMAPDVRRSNTVSADAIENGPEC